MKTDEEYVREANENHAAARRRAAREAAAARPKPLVYIAGPYSHPDPVANTHRAIREGLRLRDTYDIAVLIPHLTLAAHLIEPRPDDYWYQFDLDQIPACHALVRLPGISTGADREVALARGLGLPVLNTEADLATWVAAWRCP